MNKQQLIASLITLIVTFIILLSLFFLKTREKILNILDTKNDMRLIFAPLILIALYAGYCSATGGVEKNIYSLAFYLITPTLIMWWATFSDRTKIDLDLLAVIILFSILDFRWIEMRKHACCEGQLLDWGLYAAFGAILITVLWACIPAMTDLKMNLQLTKKDFKLFLLMFAILTITIIPAGLATKFLVPMDFDKSGWQQFTIALKHTFSPKLLIAFIQYWVTVAIVESLVFQGVIQGLLEYKWKKNSKYAELLPVIITSVIFGLFHFNNSSYGHPNAGWANWNWMYIIFATYAGFAYGFLQKYTKSIFWVITLHALVDAIAKVTFMK